MCNRTVRFIINKQIKKAATHVNKLMREKQLWKPIFEGTQLTLVLLLVFQSYLSTHVRDD